MNRGEKENLYFWRDCAGHEIDCIVDKGERLIPMEIKSGMTITKDFFKGIRYWTKISNTPSEDSYVIYGGSINQDRKEAKVLGWKSFAREIPPMI